MNATIISLPAERAKRIAADAKARKEKVCTCPKCKEAQELERVQNVLKGWKQ